MPYEDMIITRGKCAACNCETTEDNKVYWFDYWKLDLCKSCFIQLTTDQMIELREDVLKHPPAGYRRQTHEELMKSIDD